MATFETCLAIPPIAPVLFMAFLAAPRNWDVL
jgi:hypothetical protein